MMRSVGRFLKDNSLTLVLMLLFLMSLAGQWLAGWRVENEELQRHGPAGIGLFAYLHSPGFLSALFENWESEFLQMAAYVVLTATLIQRGSSESRKPDAGSPEELPSSSPDAPRLARVGGLAGWLYAHSLGLTLAVLFIASFVLHWSFSFRAAAAEAAEHGEPAMTAIGYLVDPQLWFESFQNWQSEFLSTAVLVVLSIFLRQKNSPESKPVAAAHGETGA
ncbi:hypothetical protein LJR219_004207 [Phenylobacterium sp. LjRoot219]|uniref:DUF6766 family protein n=1 Tax=Phenylobacterium sp. LjRoot219 TaxID=3342283 RepID=UPI003ED01D06